MANCLSTTIRKIGTTLKSSYHKASVLFDCAFRRKKACENCVLQLKRYDFDCDVINAVDKCLLTAIRNKSMSCVFGLVCGTSLSTPSGYEILWASDGILFTVDNGYLYVRK